MLSVYKGEKGGPVAEVVRLIGELVDVKRAPITFEVHEGTGKYTIGESVYAEMEPYRGPGGKPTLLVDSIFSSIPGSPAYVAKANSFKMDSPELGLKVDIKGHNAIQGYFYFEAQ